MIEPTLSNNTDWLSRYQRWRHIAEPAFWVLFFCTHAALNSFVVLIDITRSSLPLTWWQPVLWEWSSNLMLLVLVPFVVQVRLRKPLHIHMFRKNLKWHLLATILYCLIHVIGMVAIRKLVYALNGVQYSFGHWPTEFLYEYAKDFRAYATVLLILAFYDLFITRWQGEARLLGAPDTGEPVSPIDRPDRFLVKKLGKEFLLPAHEVEYLQAMGNYVNLHVRGKDYPLRSTMAEIETRFDPAHFVRVHRSYILNLNAIVQIEPLDSGDARALLHSGATVPISRRYKEKLRSIITTK